MSKPFYFNRVIAGMQKNSDDVNTNANTNPKSSLLGMLIRGYLSVKGQNKPMVREKVKVE